MATHPIATRTALSPSSSGALLSGALQALPTRLDDRQLALVEELASSSLPTLPPVDHGDLEERLLLLMSTLPRQSAGERDGVLKVEGYLRVLRRHTMPLAQVEFMVDQALEKCRWLPSPAELVSIAQDWRRDDDAVRCRREAAVLARREREARFDEARTALQRGELEQESIDALPARWREIFETQGLLRHCACGGFMARPQPSMDAAIESFEQLRDQITNRFRSQREGATT